MMEPRDSPIGTDSPSNVVQGRGAVEIELQDVSDEIPINEDADTNEQNQTRSILLNQEPQQQQGPIWFVYSQFRALFLKNVAKQRRQYAQNFLQILFSLVVLLLPLIAFWTDLRVPETILDRTNTPTQDSQPLMINDYYYVRLNRHCCGLPVNRSEIHQRRYYLCAVTPQVYGFIDLTENQNAASLMSNVQTAETMFLDPANKYKSCSLSPRGVPFQNTEHFYSALIEGSKYFTDCVKQQNNHYYCDRTRSLNYPFVSYTIKNIQSTDTELLVSYDVQSETNLISSYNGYSEQVFMRYVNTLSQAFLKMHTEQELPLNSLYVKKFPKLLKEYEDRESMSHSLAVTLTTFMFLPLSVQFLMPMYMFDRIKERSNTLRDYIRMFGVSLFFYDVVQYLFDYILYSVVAIFTVSVGFAGGYSFFVMGNPVHYIIMLCLWGHLQIALGYFFTCFIRQPRYAAVFGYLCVLANMVLAAAFNILLLDTGMPPVWYLIYPPFVLYRCFAVIMFRYGPPNNVHGIEDLDRQIYALFCIMLVQTIVLLSFSTLFEYLVDLFKKQQYSRAIMNWLKRFKRKREDMSSLEDTHIDIVSTPSGEDDVKAEKNAIINDDFGDRSVCLKVEALRKTYGSNPDVNRPTLNDLYIALDKGECFGLLGKNGAGKTSFINILSGFTPLDSGNITINGLDLKTAQKNKMLALCPQHDTLFEQLSVEDHLLFLTRIKGLRGGFRREYQHVKEIIEEVGLEEARRRLAKDLSGGMKRRLSIAMALTGSPQLVLLDEPTTGLDPASRRDIWKIVTGAAMNKNRCILLTTHDLEEAEALCNRIGILRKGSLQCLGTLLHLKRKFETGYKITVSVMKHKPTTLDFSMSSIMTQREGNLESVEERITAFVKSLLPNSQLDYGDDPYFVFRVQQIDTKLSHLFSVMDDQRERHKFGLARQDGFTINWSVNHASLEDLFLKVVKPSLLERSGQ
ncbi:ABC transporter A family member [Acrasis kona]|uniref:ABC transporter A family member n=1 Tax=Acrasis kona TaxID=1008807 RepID=A0AAW2ZRH3_9EUKA